MLFISPNAFNETGVSSGLESKSSVFSARHMFRDSNWTSHSAEVHSLQLAGMGTAPNFVLHHELFTDLYPNKWEAMVFLFNFQPSLTYRAIYKGDNHAKFLVSWYRRPSIWKILIEVNDLLLFSKPVSVPRIGRLSHVSSWLYDLEGTWKEDACSH